MQKLDPIQVLNGRTFAILYLNSELVSKFMIFYFVNIGLLFKRNRILKKLHLFCYLGEGFEIFQKFQFFKLYGYL